MATKSISNFSTPSPNTNDFLSWMQLLSATYTKEGIVEGFNIYSNTTNNSVKLQYGDSIVAIGNSYLASAGASILGFAVISLNDILRPVLETGVTARNIVLTPNSTGSVRRDLICIKVDDTALTTDIVSIQGTSTNDPDLASLESSTVKYIPIARVRLPANLGVITNADIDLTGACNTADLRIIRPFAKYRGISNFVSITTAQETANTPTDGDVWYNQTEGRFKFFQNGQTIPLRSTYTIWKQTPATTIIGSTVTGVTGPTGAIFQVFDNNVATQVNGTGNLTLPPNALTLGERIIFRWTQQGQFPSAPIGSIPSIIVPYIGVTPTINGTAVYNDVYANSSALETAGSINNELFFMSGPFSYNLNTNWLPEIDCEDILTVTAVGASGTLSYERKRKNWEVVASNILTIKDRPVITSLSIPFNSTIANTINFRVMSGCSRHPSVIDIHRSVISKMVIIKD